MMKFFVVLSTKSFFLLANQRSFSRHAQSTDEQEDWCDYSKSFLTCLLVYSINLFTCLSYTWMNVINMLKLIESYWKLELDELETEWIFSIIYYFLKSKNAIDIMRYWELSMNMKENCRRTWRNLHKLEWRRQGIIYLLPSVFNFIAFNHAKLFFYYNMEK